MQLNLGRLKMISLDQNNQHLKVLGISGSLRKGSFNTALLRAAQELAPNGMEITIFDLADIPLYNGDVEAAGDPEPVAALKSAIRNADAVLFATPEYNYSISGVLKNAIDWASRDRSAGSLQGKPVAMIGAGGMAKPGVLVTFPWQKFDEVGRLIDQDIRTFLHRHLDSFAQWIQRVGTPREALVAQR
jgi:chromate reductase